MKRRRRKSGRPKKGETGLLFMNRGRGGLRAGAGRPKKEGAGVSHLRRPDHRKDEPVHVTWRIAEGLPSLRRRSVVSRIEKVFEAGCERFGFRLVHYSVQSNHVHMLCEAKDKQALRRGLQGLAIRFSKALNKKLGRKGKVFADRYHARALSTPKDVRNVLRYVINNVRHHGRRRAADWIDPYSSGRFFDGYRGRTKAQLADAWMHPRVPVAPARVWLLTKGWRRHRLIAVDEMPGGTHA